MFNPIRHAKSTAAMESKRKVPQPVMNADEKKGNQWSYGELQWFEELERDRNKAQPVWLRNGEREAMTEDEVKLFQHTPFEAGAKVYHYEGQMNRKSKSGQPNDPRHATREGLGALRYPAGEVFEGHWRHDKRHGEGVFSTPIGYRYQGPWRDDQPHGLGGEETFRGDVSVAGSYDNGAPDGNCVLSFRWDNRYRYEGKFKNGVRHGHGVIFYDNGDIFEGTWQEGKREGRGVTSSKDKKDRIRQYVTYWRNDQLIEAPTAVEGGKRTAAPLSNSKFQAHRYKAADLTKWKVRDDVTELTMEHFMRVKLGFEDIDADGSGMLSLAELANKWGSDEESQVVLKKLDNTRSVGTTTLEEVFSNWYPNVPSTVIKRYMANIVISPEDVFRLRGFLAGMVGPEHTPGFYQVAGAKERETNFSIYEEPTETLSFRNLEKADYMVGGERFTYGMYNSAKAASDPPGFLEFMEILFPTTLASTLARYELVWIPHQDIELIKAVMIELGNSKHELVIEQFESAQAAFRRGEIDDMLPIHQTMEVGFYKGQPEWSIGPLRVSVNILEKVDRFNRPSGTVGIQDLLRYFFPNVHCSISQDLVMKRRPGGPCHDCQICNTQFKTDE